MIYLTLYNIVKISGCFQDTFYEKRKYVSIIMVVPVAESCCLSLFLLFFLPC